MKKKNRNKKKQLSQLSSKKRVLNQILFFLFILLFPTQLGKHLFFNFSYLSGIRVDYLAPTLYLTDGIVFLLLLLNINSLLRFFKNPRVVFLIVLLAINLLFSLSKEISIYRDIKIIELFIVFAIAAKHILQEKIILFAFAISALTELLLSILQLVYKHSLQGIFYFLGERFFTLSTPGIAKASLEGVEMLRPYGTFSHPNSLAGFYLLVYFFFLARKTSPTTSVLRTTLLFVCSLLVLFSFSKVAIFVFVTLNAVYVFRSRLYQSCRFCMISRLGILTLVSLLFLSATTDPLSAQKRLTLLKNAFSIVMSQPFFGVGLGNYLLAQNQFAQNYPTFLNQPVHNIFLLLLSEFGIILFGMLIVILFRAFYWLLLRYPYIVAVVVITGFFDHYWITLQQNSLLLAFILGKLALK
ncbi:O-antigen ligase family protein [Candidatus Roizmanbacteria bacterium]|nr:O-antigen ligase family protein [Candidatus Roizmanbacteria bacterium]